MTYLKRICETSALVLLLSSSFVPAMAAAAAGSESENPKDQLSATRGLTMEEREVVYAKYDHAYKALRNCQERCAQQEEKTSKNRLQYLSGALHVMFTGTEAEIEAILNKQD